ncbi:putative aldose 1-epimerase [Hibiscus syriacus]|uniref:Aldose 1-epimerase n=1 Tax=Hibiscus syriacus TaxID=106335 RepID=A0A6A2ZHY0_HIBSY|nr:putative aldose 1-epimerase [Hibiscus syriacus]
MATSAENAIAKAAEQVTDGMETNGSEATKKEEEVAVEVEPKTGVSFPLKLDDGKQLNCVGVRKKSMLGLGIKIYAFGVYTDNEKLKDVLKSKIGTAPEKPDNELYQLVINSDVEMVVRLVIVFSSLTITMSMARKKFGDGLGESIKKLNGGKKNDELAHKLMGEASDSIKLTGVRYRGFSASGLCSGNEGDGRSDIQG